MSRVHGFWTYDHPTRPLAHRLEQDCLDGRWVGHSISIRQGVEYPAQVEFADEASLGRWLAKCDVELRASMHPSGGGGLGARYRLTYMGQPEKTIEWLFDHPCGATIAMRISTGLDNLHSICVEHVLLGTGANVPVEASAQDSRKYVDTEAQAIAWIRDRWMDLARRGWREQPNNAGAPRPWQGCGLYPIQPHASAPAFL